MKALINVVSGGFWYAISAMASLLLVFIAVVSFAFSSAFWFTNMVLTGLLGFLFKPK